MATHRLTLLPPMIHELQLKDGIPAPLANCCSLVETWAEEGSSSGLIQLSMINEVERMSCEVSELSMRPP